MTIRFNWYGEYLRGKFSLLFDFYVGKMVFHKEGKKYVFIEIDVNFLKWNLGTIEVRNYKAVDTFGLYK